MLSGKAEPFRTGCGKAALRIYRLIYMLWLLYGRWESHRGRGENRLLQEMKHPVKELAN
jgi:hypothetical protein